MTATILQTAEIEDLARRALIAGGTSEGNARSLARAIAAAERDGIASHGLAYLATYCEHVGCGKVDGNATPERRARRHDPCLRQAQRCRPAVSWPARAAPRSGKPYSASS